MLRTLKVEVSELVPGMYVSALDRPWLETPFLIQGFVLENQEHIDRVRQYCEFVYIDKVRSITSVGRSRLHSAAPDQERQVVERPRIPIERIFAGRNLKAYGEDTPWHEEHGRAELAVDSLLGDIEDILRHVSDGGTLDVVRIKKAVSPIVDSMGRNPDACMWLTRLKQHDQYTYQHALSSSIWAVALGRQIGLGRLDLRSLAMGGMLMDVGKLRVAPELLRAGHQLDEREEGELRLHVSNGLTLLTEKGMLNQDVLDMVAHHHERHDGSGYPNGLAGDRIPAVARIAGIVDTYDALTSDQPYSPAVSPSEAIRIIYNARDQEFQAELVEAFIQAVGVYPAGTLVELSSGEVGVVVAESRTRRMLPKVTVLLDADKKALPRSRLADLLQQSEQGPEHTIRIRRSLEPGAFGIDLRSVEFPGTP
jgi:HD-GYP domain-containing protein (c-di-GMP phosphodiesterase class II)